MPLTGENLLAAMESLPLATSEEGMSLATQWIDSHEKKVTHFIGGDFVVQDGSFAPILAPASREALLEAVTGEASHVDLAVDAAQAALESWQTDGNLRAAVLTKLAKELEKRQKLLAVLESLNTGRNIKVVETDVAAALRTVYHYAGWARLCSTEFQRYKSVGVVATIMPATSLTFLSSKVIPALAAGNTVVIQPSNSTALPNVLFAEMCKAAGFPAGVLNVLFGGRAVGRTLAENPNVKMLCMDGNLRLGKHIRDSTAGWGKRVNLELGGKNAAIIFDTADLDSACETIIAALCSNPTLPPSRVLVQESVCDSFFGKLKSRLAQLKVGQPLDRNADFGAVPTLEQLERIKFYIDLARTENAEVISTATLPGNFCAPVLIKDIQTASRVVQEQIPGPVLCVLPFRTAKEAIAMANNSIFGQAAALFTENSALAIETAKKLKTGCIWVNSYGTTDPACSWGGVKQSGTGNKGGKDCMLEFLQPKWANEKQPCNADVLAAATSVPDSALVKTIQAANAAQEKWGALSGHERALRLYAFAEKVDGLKAQIIADLEKETGVSADEAALEFSVGVSCLHYWAALADKHAGEIMETTHKALAMQLNEPIGVIGVFTPDATPFAAFCSLIGSASSRGNFVLAVPSKKVPKSVLDIAAGLPAYKAVGGDAAELVPQLGGAEDVQGLWYFGSAEGSKLVELKSSSNMKRTWVSYGLERNWLSDEQGQSVEFMKNSIQTKCIWFPVGDIFAN